MPVKFTEEALFRTIRNRIAAASIDVILAPMQGTRMRAASGRSALEDALTALSHQSMFTKKTALTILSKLCAPSLSPGGKEALLKLRQAALAVQLDPSDERIPIERAAEKLDGLEAAAQSIEDKQRVMRVREGLDTLRAGGFTTVHFQYLWSCLTKSALAVVP